MISSTFLGPDTLGVRLLAYQWAEEHDLDASQRGIRSGSPGSYERNNIARMKTFKGPNCEAPYISTKFMTS